MDTRIMHLRSQMLFESLRIMQQNANSDSQKIFDEMSYYSCEEQTENSELEEKNKERNSENSRAIQKGRKLYAIRENNNSLSLMQNPNSISKSPREKFRSTPEPVVHGGRQISFALKSDRISLRSFYNYNNNLNLSIKASSVNSISELSKKLHEAMEKKINWDVSKVVEIKNLDIKTLLKTSITHIGSKDIQRLQISLEFVKNEANFVYGLSCIGKYFYQPFCDEHLLSKPEIDKIFSQFPEFFTFYKNFASILCESCSGKNFSKDFVDTIHENFVGTQKGAFTSIWMGFLEHNTIGRSLLKETINNNYKLKNFISMAENNQNLKKMGLFDLFQIIHKHVAEYPMYFQRFLDYTPQTHEQRSKVVEIYEASKDLLVIINEILRNVQDDELHSNYGKKIEKCIKSEKYINLMPKNINFATEKIQGHYSVQIKNKKEKLPYIMLCTTNYIFFLYRKPDRVKFKPIEIFALDTLKKIHIIMIIIRNIKSIEETVPESSEINITATHVKTKFNFKLQIFMDSKENRKEFISLINKSLENLKEISTSSFNSLNKILEKKYDSFDRNSTNIRSFRNREVDNLAKIYVSNSEEYYTKFNSLKEKHQNLEKGGWHNLISDVSLFVSESYKNRRSRENVENLIVSLNEYLNSMHFQSMPEIISTVESDPIISNSPKSPHSLKLTSSESESEISHEET